MYLYITKKNKDMKSILNYDQYELLKLNINECANQLNACGINVKFSGHSFANGCSIYFTDDNQNKYRFSDHSVTNLDRICNEYHFVLPFKQTGSIANSFNCADKSKYGFKERFIKYNDNAKMMNIYFQTSFVFANKFSSYIF